MIRTFPDVGKRQDGKQFSKEVKEIYNVFKISNNAIKHDEEKIIKLSGGNPLNYKPFKLCKKYLKQVLNKKNIYKYPAAAGDENYRNMIADYLLKEGFNSGKDLDIDNVIVTMSTTHGFKLILDVIARPYDVVLMPSPCYGLFVFFPERINVGVRFIELDEEDNYYINSEKLDKRIKEINEELELKYKDKLDYIPKVVGFLNQNPHNPTGVVMGKNERDLINSISKVCKQNSVYVIDDLVYKELVFNNNDEAIAMAYNSEYFDNTITLMGLSKCYGYASARAGIIVARKDIISKTRDVIFQQMDSIPVLQCAMLAGAFNTTKKRSKEYFKYFNKLNKEYEYRYLLLKCLVDGIETLNDINIHNFNKKDLINKVRKDIEAYASSYNMAEELMQGISNVNLLDNLEVMGGFFALLDYSKLKGKKDKDGKEILNDVDVFNYLFNEAGIKIIMGSSIGFDRSKMIGRVTFALEIKELINSFEIMKNAIEVL